MSKTTDKSLDPTLITALATSIEACLNTALRYDPATRSKLKALQSKDNCPLLKLEVRSPSLELYFAIDNEQVSINSINDDEKLPPATLIKGNLFELLNLLVKEEISITGSGVEIRGKVQTLAAVKDAFADFEIDWEQALSDKIGSLPAHQVAQLTIFIGTRLKHSSYLAISTLSDALIHELRIVPSKHEVFEFCEEVDKLRAASDRLQARLQLVQKQNPKNT